MAFGGALSCSPSPPTLSSSCWDPRHSSSTTRHVIAPLALHSSPFPVSQSPKYIVAASRKRWVRQSTIETRRNQEPQTTEILEARRSLQRGIVSAPLPIPDHIQKPPYLTSRKMPEIASVKQIHDSEGIAKMKAACHLAAHVLEYAGTLVRPSMTTNEIDEAVHRMIIEAGAYPSSLGYGGFPKSVCISVNECLCHGIPDSRQLEDGDIVTIDLMVYLNGYHGDTSKTFICGSPSESVQHLLRVTKECLERGISLCKDGAYYRNIGKIISKHALRNGYNVVEDFTGHGIGRVIHSEPVIWNFENNELGQMVEGETFTIEPVLTMGGTEYRIWDDNWTIVTTDGSLSAHFEHTILITKYGAEILTKV